MSNIAIGIGGSNASIGGGSEIEIKQEIVGNEQQTTFKRNGVLLAEIDVADELNNTSGTKALSAKQGKILKEELENAQMEAQSLVFDQAPASGSGHPVTSNGIYNAVEGCVQPGKSQSFTDVQKAQARENINAVSPADSVSNLVSWAERQQREVVDEWSDKIRTTGGSMSIDSTKNAYILFLKSKGVFSADAISASCVNLLNPTNVVGSYQEIQVPKMLRGTYGMSDEANGILFVKSDGTNVAPTVKFSATKLSTDAEISAASAASTWTQNGKTFYTASTEGYFYVSLPSGVTAANLCARIAWSRGYNEFVAYTADSTVSLTSVLNAVASTYASVFSNVSKLLAVGDISSEIIFSGSTAAWTRKISAITPTWTNTAGEEEGTYVHTAEIPDTNGAMNANGAAARIKADGTIENLQVSVTTVSYTDENETSTATVIYELETYATGTVSIANNYTPNDFGTERMVNCSGDFVVRTSYFQTIPDSVFSMLSKVDVLEADASAFNPDNLGDVHCKSLDSDERIKISGFEYIKMGSGEPTFAPEFVGQRYMDTTNKKEYLGFDVSSSTDFVILN